MNAKVEALLAKVDDLIRQATEEKSHHYTASVLRECREMIVALSTLVDYLNKGELK